MKKICLIILGIIWVAGLTAREDEKVPVQSFFKLSITNEKGEVLLISDGQWWEITGSRYNQSMTVPRFVDWIAARLGVEVENIRLRGLFTFYFEWHKVQRPTLLYYFTATYKGGEPTVPAGCTDIQWVSKEKLGDYIPYNEMVMILERIYRDDDLVGGNFMVEKTEQGCGRRGKLTGPFYKLN